MSVFASNHVFRINIRNKAAFHPPVAQPVTGALHAHPCFTTSYRCNSCPPLFHNQLQMHFMPPPVAQLVTGAHHAGPSGTTSYRCTSCRLPVS